MHANTKSFSLIPGLQATVWWAVERTMYRASLTLKTWNEARQRESELAAATRALQEMGDHELRDLGLTRSQIGQAVRGGARRG